MKFVSLVIIAMIFSFGASAQTTRNAPKKNSVVHEQQKKGGKAKLSGRKIAAAKNSDVTTLRHENSYKAKWTFEEMLKRRMEIDAEKGERELKKD